MKRLALLAVVLAVAACGKKGNPLPPLPLEPAPVTDLEAWQDGTRIVLEATLPAKTVGEEALGAIVAIEIGRSLGRQGEIAERLEGARLGESAKGGRLVWSEFVPEAAFSPHGPGRELVYSLRVRSADGWSLPSNPVKLAPRPLELAPEIRDVALAEAGVRMVLAPRDPDPSLQALGSPRGSVVYRRREGEPEPLDPVGVVHDPEVVFFDRGVAEGCWIYRAAALLDGERHRGPRGSEFVIEVVDAYPPPAPHGLEFFREERRVRLLWEPVVAPDLAGYVVERALEGEAPVRCEGWQTIASLDARQAAYVDEGVGPRERPCYRAKSLDADGNLSAPSEPIEVPAF